MKGREVEELLKGIVNPKIIRVLREMCEDFRVQQEEIVSVAQALDKLTELLLQLGATIEMTQGAVDKLKGIRGVESE